MKSKDTLKVLIESFSELKKNWGSYNEDEITIQSIMTAHKLIDTIPHDVDIQTVYAFPMRNGGIQIEIGDFKDIEVLNYTITEIHFDGNLNIISKNVSELQY